MATDESTKKSIHSLVLDATPLITQSASALQQFGQEFYTTPGVRAELKDEHSKSQLAIWGDTLVVRQPKQIYINKVSAFAKLTGDYAALSMNDVHVIALAYELEYLKNGDKYLRSYPGQKLDSDEPVPEYKPKYQRHEEVPEEENETEKPEEDDGFQVVSRKKNKPRKYRNFERPVEKKEEKENKEEKEIQEVEAKKEEDVEEKKEAEESIKDITEELESSTLTEEYDEEDDDGEWITPTNLQETMFKDTKESVQDQDSQEVIQVALSTGDFACQNTSMQLGLKLMNPVSGKQIKRVRNYMYRCHACFHMSPMLKSGVRKHFCPKCGGDTLLRCAVSVDKATGKVTPHLKANFQWITKGQVYSVASPLSKNTKKQQGKAGYQHNKENRHRKLQDPEIFREDQKEYTQALKESAYHRRKSEKMLEEWIGGGSADNIISPFGSSHRSSDVRVGRGRNANAVKGKKKR